MKHFFLFVSSVLLLFSSCQKNPLPPITQQLNLNVPIDPATLDPRKGGDIISSLFHFMLFDGLVRREDDNTVSMALAEKVNLSEDRRVYTFYLREAYWSNGEPITAWDFEKSWKDILHPDFPAMNAHLLYPIKNAEDAKLGKISLSQVGIKSLDARILEITLDRPTPYFLDLIAFCVFFPVNSTIDHSKPDWDLQEGKDFPCSGPFLLKRWKRNDYLILEKNPSYFKANEVALEEIHFCIVSSEITALQMYEKGQLDILGQPLIPLPTDAIPQLAKEGLLNISRVPATTFCSFNVDAFPFNNSNIRKGLSFAINREEIVRNITQLDEEPALGIIPPVLKKQYPSHPFFKDHDREKALFYFKKGLNELQLTKETFPEIEYLYSHSESQHKIAQVLQQQWRAVLGINTKLKSVDKKTLLQVLKSRDYRIAQSFWMAQFNDPINIFERFKSKENVKNYPNWENQKYTSLINLSCEAKTPDERAEILEQAEALFIEEMPIAPIFHWNSAYIAKPYVKSHGTAPIGYGYFEKVYIDVEMKESKGKH